MRRTGYILLTAVLLLASCREKGIDTYEQDGSSIYLSAYVERAVETRAPYVPVEDEDKEPDYPTAMAPLAVDVWAATADGTVKFPDSNLNGDGGTVALHTTASFQSSEPQLLKDAIYSSDGTTIYFVSFHPQSWTGNDAGTSATYAFDGNDDVMFAPMVSGQYGSDESKYPCLHFRHLLTWFRIEMKAENETVAKAWGKLKKMTVRSANKVTVNELGGSQVSDAQAFDAFFKDKVSFSGNASLSFYCTEEEDVYSGTEVTVKKKFTDDVFPKSGGYEIKGKFDNAKEDIDPVEVAYTMCAPAVATASDTDGVTYEYYIDVETENRTVTVPINLMQEKDVEFTGSTRGKQFTLSMVFVMGNTISIATRVTDWTSEGIVVSELGDVNLQ